MGTDTRTDEEVIKEYIINRVMNFTSAKSVHSITRNNKQFFIAKFPLSCTDSIYQLKTTFYRVKILHSLGPNKNIVHFKVE